MEFLVFGCSLDVLDAPEKVAMKVAFLDGLERGLVDRDLALDREAFSMKLDALDFVERFRPQITFPTVRTGLRIMSVKFVQSKLHLATITYKIHFSPLKKFVFKKITLYL